MTQAQTGRAEAADRTGAIPLGPVTVSRDDVIAFARAYDPLPFHLDETAAKKSLLGGLASSGWQTGALCLRMLSDAWVGPGALRGLVSVNDLKWRKPVFVGDTIAGTATVAALLPDPETPQTGTVSVETSLANARGETVLTMRLTYRVDLSAEVSP